MTNDVSVEHLILNDLLWLDDEYLSKDALPDCFGDRYLCATNSLFVRIRELFLSLGFRYASNASSLWDDYDSFSLLMLQDIIDSESVPYRKTTPTIRRIVERNPSLEIPIAMLQHLVRRNYTLHESAHCVSYRLLTSEFGIADPITNKTLYVLVCLLCESYANTIERLAAALVTGEAERALFSLNSFLDYRTDHGSMLADCLSVFGFERLFNVGMHALFFLNTHQDNPDDRAVDMLLSSVSDAIGSTGAERALLRVGIQYGFGLSKKFRGETTPLFFRYMKCESEFRALCTQPFDNGTLSTLGISESFTLLSTRTCAGLFLASRTCKATNDVRGEFNNAGVLIESSRNSG